MVFRVVAIPALHTAGVAGSSPAPPTKEIQHLSAMPSAFFLFAPQVVVNLGLQVTEEAGSFYSANFRVVNGNFPGTRVYLGVETGDHQIRGCRPRKRSTRSGRPQPSERSQTKVGDDAGWTADRRWPVHPWPRTASGSHHAGTPAAHRQRRAATWRAGPRPQPNWERRAAACPGSAGLCEETGPDWRRPCCAAQLAGRRRQRPHPPRSRKPGWRPGAPESSRSARLGGHSQPRFLADLAVVEAARRC